MSRRLPFLSISHIAGRPVMPNSFPKSFSQPLPSKYCGHAIFSFSTNAVSFSICWSKLTPTISNPFALSFSKAARTLGISFTHGPHHVAQKSTSTTFPVSFATSTARLSNAVNFSATGLPISPSFFTSNVARSLTSSSVAFAAISFAISFALSPGAMLAATSISIP